MQTNFIQQTQDNMILSLMDKNLKVNDIVIQQNNNLETYNVFLEHKAKLLEVHKEMYYNYLYHFSKRKVADIFQNNSHYLNVDMNEL